MGGLCCVQGSHLQRSNSQIIQELNMVEEERYTSIELHTRWADRFEALSSNTSSTWVAPRHTATSTSGSRKRPSTSSQHEPHVGRVMDRGVRVLASSDPHEMCVGGVMDQEVEVLASSGPYEQGVGRVMDRGVRVLASSDPYEQHMG